MGVSGAALYLLLLTGCLSQPIGDTNNQGWAPSNGNHEASSNENALPATGHTAQPNSPPPATQDIHGGVKMGQIRSQCDNVSWHLSWDWDNSTDYNYTCQEGEKRPVIDTAVDPWQYCMPKDDIPNPIHICMRENITYTDRPPTAGSHRPNWPRFGEYVYVPPQRWVHSLEHGSVVMLYHPCAPSSQIELLKSITRSCIRKHVITPYRHLPIEQPLAVVTYGCKLLMNSVDEALVKEFIMATAMQTLESPVTRDGKYDWGLLRPAEVVSFLNDSVLCPGPDFKQKLAAEEEKAKADATQTDKPDDAWNVVDSEAGEGEVEVENGDIKDATDPYDSVADHMKKPYENNNADAILQHYKDSKTEEEWEIEQRE